MNLYLVYELDNCSRNPSTDFTVKICLFITVKLTRNPIKSEFIYNG